MTCLLPVGSGEGRNPRLPRGPVVIALLKGLELLYCCAGVARHAAEYGANKETLDSETCEGDRGCEVVP